MITVNLIAVGQNELEQIPLSIADAFNQFDHKEADLSFVAVVRFGSNIDFYKSCRLFMNISLNQSEQNLMMLATRSTNRVHPAIGVPEETGLHVVLAKALKARVHEYLMERDALGKSYQFFRIILIFDTIYNRSQTCCCGLIGFSGYDLFRRAQPMTRLVKDAITAHAGAIKNAHTVFVDLNSNDTIKTHGASFLP